MAETEISPIVERLIQFIESTGLTSTQFADKAGIPRPSLSQMLHGRNKSLNNQVLAKLNQAFPQLNIVWLLFNQGNMLNEGNIRFSEPQNTQNAIPGLSEDGDNDAFDDFESTDLESLLTPQSARANIFREINTPEMFSAGPIPRSSGDIQCPPTVMDQTATTSDNGNATGNSNVENHESSVKRKKISSILVLYTDGSFDKFLPGADLPRQ